MDIGRVALSVETGASRRERAETFARELRATLPGELLDAARHVSGGGVAIVPRMRVMLRAPLGRVRARDVARAIAEACLDAAATRCVASDAHIPPDGDALAAASGESAAERTLEMLSRVDGVRVARREHEAAAWLVALARDDPAPIWHVSPYAQLRRCTLARAFAGLTELVASADALIDALGPRWARALAKRCAESDARGIVQCLAASDDVPAEIWRAVAGRFLTASPLEARTPWRIALLIATGEPDARRRSALVAAGRTLAAELAERGDTAKRGDVAPRRATARSMPASLGVAAEHDDQPGSERTGAGTLQQHDGVTAESTDQAGRVGTRHAESSSLETYGAGTGTGVPCAKSASATDGVAVVGATSAGTSGSTSGGLAPGAVSTSGDNSAGHLTASQTDTRTTYGSVASASNTNAIDPDDSYPDAARKERDARFAIVGTPFNVSDVDQHSANDAAHPDPDAHAREARDDVARRESESVSRTASDGVAQGASGAFPRITSNRAAPSASGGTAPDSSGVPRRDVSDEQKWNASSDEVRNATDALAHSGRNSTGAASSAINRVARTIADEIARRSSDGFAYTASDGRPITATDRPAITATEAPMHDGSDAPVSNVSDDDARSVGHAGTATSGEARAADVTDAASALAAIRDRRSELAQDAGVPSDLTGLWCLLPHLAQLTAAFAPSARRAAALAVAEYLAGDDASNDPAIGAWCGGDSREDLLEAVPGDVRIPRLAVAAVRAFARTLRHFEHARCTYVLRAILSGSGLVTACDGGWTATLPRAPLRIVLDRAGLLGDVEAPWDGERYAFVPDGDSG